MEEKDRDTDTPRRSSNMEKAEGGPWTSDPDTVEVADRYSEGVGGVDENTGGLSNRPLSEEVERQHNLPDRGTSRAEEGAEGDVER
jgi:hypothetical protein